MTNKVKNVMTNVKKRWKNYKETPKSKTKSFLKGFGTVLGIFSLTLFGPTLAAVAKDLPVGNLKPEKTKTLPAKTCPTPTPTLAESNAAFSGAAAAICSLAVTSGSFAIGVACGCLVVLGILTAQGQCKLNK